MNKSFFLVFFLSFIILITFFWRNIMAKENKVKVDEIGFQKAMKIQKKRAKDKGNFKINQVDRNWSIVSEGEHSKFLRDEKSVSKS